jgi:cytoskeletal protein RodZ
MSTGERLRQARLDAGKTLGQVAAETKIQLWILEAIERDDLSHVPGGIFIRGYLTAFARAVQVNPSDVLSAYLLETLPAPVAPVPSPSPDLNEGPVTPLWQYVAIVAMVLGAAVLWRDMTHRSPEVATAPAPPPSATASQTPAASPAPAVTLPNEAGATATTGAIDTNAPLVVQLHTNDEVWIEADADGERKAYRLFEQGQELRVEGQNEIRLLVGNAAAVTYTINGRPGRPLGRNGAVRQFVVSPRNIESLTAPAQRTDG